MNHPNPLYVWRWKHVINGMRSTSRLFYLKIAYLGAHVTKGFNQVLELQVWFSYVHYLRDSILFLRIHRVIQERLLFNFFVSSQSSFHWYFCRDVYLHDTDTSSVKTPDNLDPANKETCKYDRYLTQQPGDPS